MNPPAPRPSRPPRPPHPPAALLLSFDDPLPDADVATVEAYLRRRQARLSGVAQATLPDWIVDAARAGDDALHGALALWLALHGVDRRRPLALIEPDATGDYLMFQAVVRTLHALRGHPPVVVARWISLPGMRRTARPPLVWQASAGNASRRRGGPHEPVVQAVLLWLERVCLEHDTDPGVLHALAPAVRALVAAIQKLEGRCGAEDLLAAIDPVGRTLAALAADDTAGPGGPPADGERLPAALLVARTELRGVPGLAVQRLATLLQLGLGPDAAPPPGPDDGAPPVRVRPARRRIRAD